MSDNIYYNPEKYGLEVVDIIDDPNSCYSFDSVLVVKNATGRVGWLADSGCSCPVPYEDFGVDDIQWLPETMDDFLAATRDRESYDGRPFYSSTDVVDTLRALRDLGVFA